LMNLGFKLYTGNGGFYHWGLLPNGLSADEFNERLFKYDAGILPGRLCDMVRREGEDSPLHCYVRFSFGPLNQESFDNDMKIISACI